MIEQITLISIGIIIQAATFIVGFISGAASNAAKKP